MKTGILSAAIVLSLPLAAMAQSVPQKKADLEEALRIRQFICSGMADVSARGGPDYSNVDLIRCRAALDAQRAEYQRFLAENSGALSNVATASFVTRARTRTANAAQ
jgi:hypothetical protein